MNGDHDAHVQAYFASLCTDDEDGGYSESLWEAECRAMMQAERLWVDGWYRVNWED